MKTTIKIAFVFAFAVVGFVFIAAKGKTQTKTVTAGQKFKSIKVLNKMPADQMGKVMNMISASLGVNCKFCHVSNDGDYEKEGIEQKDTARKMLKMMFDLNKNYFEGRPEINCNSCHQGKSQPQRTIPLKPVEQVERPAQPVKKPTVEEILTIYETALGGKVNIEKIRSRQIKAHRIEPDGKTFEEEEIWQKGNKLRVQTIYPSKEFGDYLVTEIFDGKNAAKFGNYEKIELKPDEAEQIMREAQIFANPNLDRIYPEIKFQFVEKIEDRDVYLLFATTAGNQRERLYFDVQTGLLVRRTASTPTILGMFQYQVDYFDYKDFGGVKLPTLIKFAVPNIRWSRKILEVKNNIMIDDSKFIGK